MSKPIIVTAVSVLFLAAALALPAPAAGDDSLAGTARGTFSRHDWTLEVVDGFAYEATALFGKDPVIRVVLVASPIDRDALASAIDFGNELAQQGALRGSARIDIDPATGRWLGSSWPSCGYCGVPRSVQQSLELGEGRVRGNLRLRPEDTLDGDGPDVRLEIDLPVARVTGAEDLPADGGAPGEALRRCWRAARGDDLDAALPLCFPSDDAHARKRTAADFASYGCCGELRAEHLEVGGGRVKGDQAELLVETRDDGETSRGSMFLQRVDAGWRWIGQRMVPVWD